VIAVGQVKRWVLLATLASGLAAMANTGSARAAQPWWHMSVSSRPADLKAGVAKDEVQEIKVAASEGEVTVIEPVSYKEALNGGGFAALKYTFFKYDATHEEAQSALEGIYGAGNVRVEGGPGDVAGTKPYVVTFTGGLADHSLALMVTELNLGGLNGEASASEQSKGRADGTIVLVASNLGTGPADGGKEPVTISDRLPAGLKAVGMSGISSTYSSGFDNHGPVDCVVSSLSCTFEGVLPAYEQIEVSVPVLVQSGASSGEVDEASVSGGGAQMVSGLQSLTFGGEPVFGIESYEQTLEQQGGTIDTQAGSHPFQFTTTFNLNQTSEGEPVALPKDVRFNLPPGLVGNPTPLAQCTIGQFLSIKGASDECAPDTAIGVTRTVINVEGQVETSVNPVFNLEPQAGEPARFGFYAIVAPIILDTSVRTGSDYGVTVTVHNINQVPGFISSQTTLWGVPGDPVHDNVRGWGCLGVVTGHGGGTCSPQEELNSPPFLSLPTSCTGPLVDSMEADPWDRPGGFVSLSDPMRALDGCNRLSFEPSISVAPEGRQASSPTGLTVGIHVPQDAVLNPTGLAEANVKNTTVTLPVGVAINPAAADGLMSCSSSQVALEVDAPPSCPEASKVGTVEIKSPLLPNALTGAVYLAAQDANPFGSLVALYLVAEDPVSGTLIKVAGEVKLDPVTGQLVSTFENTPQLPFEDLKLSFFGGARAPLATPAVCGPYTTSASIAPWSGSPASTPSSTFQIASGPNGSACSSPLPFDPSLTAGTTSIQAGGFSPFTMTVSREDGQQNIGAIQLHMPSGLSGLLTGVELCGEAQADAGSCGPNSLIGETTVSVGLGGDPYSVTGGKVYITGPYEGAPFGLSIVVSAKAGPYDLGTVVVRGTIRVDPTTAALTITTDSTGPYAIPHILDGIPLEVKHVNFITTRPGFTFNPTNCDPSAITGSMSSVEGSSRALSVPFQATNCATLGFKPGFSVSTSGKTSRANGASLSVKLTYPKASFGSQANIKSVKVDLPKQLPSRLTTLQKACPAKTFEANPASCPVASIVGHGKAITPLIPVPLEGPAYFVSYGGAKFPELVVALQGYGVTLDLHGETFISKAGITSSTFHTVPDAPVGSFELTLPEGKDSALAANGNLCKTKLKMPTAFTAQNGTAIHQTTPITATGCPKHKTKETTTKKGSEKHKKKK
jgi:hypothetical protein